MTQEEMILKDIERMKKLTQEKKIHFEYTILDSKGKDITKQIKPRGALN